MPSYLKKVARFYIYALLFMGFAFSEISAVPPIPRTVLFPESQEKEDAHRKILRKQFPTGSLYLPYLMGDELSGEGILIHSFPNSYHNSIYYYTYGGTVHTKLEGDGIYYPKYKTSYYNADQQAQCFIWSGTRDPQGLIREFYEFSPKLCASKVIARGYDSLTIDKRGRPIAGRKDKEGGLREYWVNSTERGWVLFQTEPDKEDFSPSFVYHEEQDVLYYATTLPSVSSINLRTGERRSLLTVGSKEGETYYPEESFKLYGGKLAHYSYVQAGKGHWRGAPIFNYIYKDLNDRLRAHFKGQDFCISYLNCLEDSWHFRVVLEKEPPLHGAYMLDTRILAFSDEKTPERTALRQVQDRLSQKTYRTCLVPPLVDIRLGISSDDEGGVSTKILNYRGARFPLTIPYFLSLPPGRQAPYPAVMYVHGGPSMDDRFCYEANVQHLTDRGYAVVQVNYRGSTSDLHLFEEGAGEWGQGMQHDLSSVADALIQEGVMDPDAVAIMGLSYGGYASLLGATVGERFHTKYFKGYKCAIAECPVTDLHLLLKEFQKEFGGIPSPTFLHELVSFSTDWSISKEDEEKLRQLSPLTYAANLSIPLLLMHGREDMRAPIHHSDLFSEALTRAGHEHIYVVFDKEGHGLKDSGNIRAAAYLKEKFLATHLGAGDVEPPDIMDVAYTDMTFMKGADKFPEMEALLSQYKGCGYLKPVPELKNFLRNLARREITFLGEPTNSPSSTAMISYQNPQMFLWRIFAQTFPTHRGVVYPRTVFKFTSLKPLLVQ